MRRAVKGGYGARALALKAALALGLGAAPLAAEPVTLAALGDSLTQGYGLAPEAGLVPQLQAWLAARGHDVTVINAGVSGDTTAGGLSRVAWTLTPEVDAMIVALGGNDMLRGIGPEIGRQNLDGILRAGQEAGLALMLVGLPAPGNYGPDYKQGWETLYPDLAAEYGAMHVANLLAPVLAEGRPDVTLMQGDGIHPNAAGVARIVEARGPEVERLIARIR